MIQKESNKLQKEYFNWMYHLVCGDKKYNNLSYKKLLYFLNTVTFYPMLELDENRRIDGIYFRYRFGYENGIDDPTIERYLDDHDCSVLEMMVALAFRVEEQITDNYIFGNRTGQWFWVMIVSLGLGHMNDEHFDESFCMNVIDKFLSRRYSPNGAGGLFTLEDPRRDLREVDIWCQFMWYLSEKENQ